VAELTRSHLPYKWYDPGGRLGFAEVADQFSKLALAGIAAGER
jgi:hypothetical protein